VSANAGETKEKYVAKDKAGINFFMYILNLESFFYFVKSQFKAEFREN
jgi:hypothetical protein